MTPTRSVLLILTAIISLTWAPAYGVSTSFWDVDTGDQFLKGEAKGTTITADGSLKLASELRMLSGTDELFIWTVEPGPDGRVYAGTGNGGKVLVVEEDSVRVILDSVELEILSLAFDQDGSIYAGTSPDGLIYKITKNGESTTFFDCPETYIWDLLVDQSGNIYAATGDLAKVYKIDRKGNGEVVFESSEAHIMCMEFLADGKILAGTQGTGLLLEIDPDGGSRVVYQAPEEEIRALRVSEDGDAYLGTVSAGQPEDETEEAQGRVIKVMRSGAATKLWRLPGAGIFSLALVGADIIVGTGADGEIHLVDLEGHSTLLAQSDAMQILSLAETSTGVVAGTGNPGLILGLGPDLEKEGTYQSKVHEAPNVAKWGRIAWEGDLSEGRLELMTRSGNTDKPGDDWSEWSEPYADATGSLVTSPPARYIQWQAVLSRGGRQGSPELGLVRLSYLETNLRPTVDEVIVYPQGLGYLEGGFDMPPRTVSQNLPDGLAVQYSLPESYVRPVPEEQTMLVRGLRTMRWVAFDDNGDRLVYDLSYRGAYDRHWKPLDKDLESPVYTWNTDGFADGSYVVRVLASDAKDNPTGQALEHSRESNSFTIDNTAPEIRNLKFSHARERVSGTGTVEDALSPIVAVSFSVDGGEWIAAEASDGVFDSKMEGFSLETIAGASEDSVISVLAREDPEIRMS